MVAAVCALFTTFTGGSGVTIIALGGLVYPILRKDGYSEGFSLGLVTASGSLGLLSPPSLPVIIYSVVASSRNMSVPADSLYLAGLVPGLLLVVLAAVYGIYVGGRNKAGRQPFRWKEAAAASWAAKWELLLPFLIIGLFESGLTSMVQTAATAFAYTVVVECFITRDIAFFRGLPGVLLRSASLMGAVLILLSIAMGLTSYLVDAQIPAFITSWVTTHIHTKLVFLLVLNLLLLVLGSVLEIYSALIILAPLIAPLGRCVRSQPNPPRRHLPRELGVGFPGSPRWPEPLAFVIALRQAAVPTLPARRPVPHHTGHRRAADHLYPSDVGRSSQAARQGLMLLRRPRGEFGILRSSHPLRTLRTSMGADRSGAGSRSL
jgi:tripartite ATP-independent transporter DctM subunit